MAKQCVTCGGVYEPISRDGLPYFHACPPITCVAVTRAGKAGLVPITKLAPTDMVRVERSGAAIDVAAADLLADDVRSGDVQLPRPNARDENVIVTRSGTGQRVTQPKAEGLGAIDVEAVAVVAPALLDVP